MDSFAIIVNGSNEFGVWPTQWRLPEGWSFIGPTGTRSEMEELLRRQFVETAPAPFIARAQPSGPSQWAD
ncbi:MAG TPA: MbtH family NRPS accessory protein [Albitalea sp.]